MKVRVKSFNENASFGVVEIENSHYEWLKTSSAVDVWLASDVLTERQMSALGIEDILVELERI